jgi:hypothetical protein
MHARRLLVGGLVGGVMVILVDFLFNGLIFARQDQAAIASVAADPAIAERPLTLAVILGIDLLMGFLLVWTYAAMRPRFGAGPRTALLAAVQVWVITLLPWTVLTYLGALTWGFWALEGVVTLVTYVAGALAGCRLYTEGTPIGTGAVATGA